MSPIELTSAQTELAFGTGSRFFEACPGAGKTRALVERYQRRVAEEPRKGIGFLSFTNAAIDEVRLRSGDALDALATPHFIGTFDSFINRFLTGPLYQRDYNQPVSFIEAWSVLTNSGVRIREQRIEPFPLEWFDFDVAGNATLVEKRVAGRFARGHLDLANANMSKICWIAGQARKRYVDAGVVSCSSSRQMAAAWLGDPATRQRMSGILRSRFSEVIVDEAQDCCEEELAILGMLREAGVDVVLVADIDQAIFGFRRAIPKGLREFAFSLPQGPRLDGNFRSSSAICATTGTLRSGDAVDTAVGANADCLFPVYVAPFNKLDEIADMAAALASRHGMVSEDLVILAHQKSHAMTAAGVSFPQNLGTNKVAMIAACSLALRSPGSTAKERSEATKALERALLSVVDGCSVKETSTTKACEEVGISGRWLRDAAIRISRVGDPAANSGRDYLAKVRPAILALEWPAGTLFGRLMVPSSDVWSSITRSGRIAKSRWSTIHGAKGREFPAVALVLPKDLQTNGDGHTVLDLWERRIDGEAKRVFYVGASRAERLLILAVHQNHLDRVCAILTERDVQLAKP